MAIYGTRVLVPRINFAAGTAARSRIQSQTNSAVNAGGHTNQSSLNLTKREAQVLRFDVLFEAAYWVIWIALIVSLLLVAWMDLREVSRTYLNQRRELWAVAAKAASEATSQGRPASEGSVNTKSDLDGKSDSPIGQ
jgi:hypothetical protein